MYSWIWGWCGFKPIARTYTVGTGWDNSSITAGMIARRVSGGVVTAIYEAKNSFTASADPANDTTNWRRCGITAQAGSSDFWWNVEPGLKWMVCAMYEVGTGWKIPQPYCFPRQDLGTICRWEHGLRRMKKSGGFGVAATNDEHWTDYDGALAAEVDWRFNRYCRLRFQVGDLVIRKNGASFTFWRCVKFVDYWDENDGAGDPANDSEHWVSWAGERSLWLDFSRAAEVAGSPWFHATPARRYQRWKETTEVFFGEVSLGVKTRSFWRDNLSGWVDVEADEWAAEWVLEPPAPPEGEDTSGVFYPETWPGEMEWVGVDFHYHRPKLSTLKLVRGVYPDATVQLQFLRNDYYLDIVKFFKYPSGSFFNGWVPEAWPGPPNYDVAQVSSQVNCSLVEVDSGDDWVEFEWTATVPWWHEFDVACIFAVNRSWPEAFARFGKKCSSNGGTIPDPYITWYDGQSYVQNGANTVHNGTVRVVQRVEVEEEVTLSGHFGDAVQRMPALPMWGFMVYGQLDRHGDFVGSTFAYDFSTGTGSWIYLMRSNAGAAVPGFSWVDARLYESMMELNRAAFVVYDTPHYWAEHLYGDELVVGVMNEVMTYNFFPDGTLTRARVSLSTFS